MHGDAHEVGRADADEGLAAQSMPFLFAIALGLALLPVQKTPVDGSLLGLALLAIGGVLALALIVIRRPAAPAWLGVLVPYAYLLSIALLRSATGGSRSGYGALLYLAPFWVALRGTRRQVVLVTIALFAVQVLQAWATADQTDAGIAIRGALLTSLVIGMMSFAVNGRVTALRLARERVRREADARAVAIDQLAESNELLARSNRDLEQFAYVSSHDLQEPLRMIRSFSQLFMQRYGTEVSEDARELLEFVTDGAERAQSLVSDLLEYSRVGSSERPFEDVSLDEVVERALDVLAPQIEDTGARVYRPDHMPVVCGDPAQLERVVVNLVGNAIKYRDPDRPPQLRIESHRIGNAVRVDVIDNGIGFDAEHSQRIFMMFQRLHARGEYDGNGIGLAICARIVERHGGRIEAHGTPGEGSTFSFTVEAVAA
jgi:signal transduction histidine kinase